MVGTHLGKAVKAVVGDWIRSTNHESRQGEFGHPATLAATLGLLVQQTLAAAGHDPASIRDALLNEPYFLLSGVFDTGKLPDTPVEFVPVPATEGTDAGRAAALAAHAFLYMETVSYGSENNGELFVNLVAIPGTGALAEKSVKDMRGHTDGVSFPLTGDDDPDNPRIAPSPDLVTLIGLRNPDHVPTMIMPTDELQARLPAVHIAELMKPQYHVSSQKTFVPGMKTILGRELVILDQPVLKKVGDATHIRYSHSKVVPAEEGGNAEKAARALEELCAKTKEPVVVEPGDLLVINNRLALHGRGPVANEYGGTTRWLLRTYGLSIGLPAHKRHLGDRPPHVLFP